MIGVVIVCRAAAGTGLCAPMLGVRILTPRTGRIGVRSIVRSGIATGVTRRGAAVLGAAIIAPIPIAHAVAGVIIARRTAIRAILRPLVLRGRILRPVSIVVIMAAGIDRFAFCLATSTIIRTVAVAGTSSSLLILENPCMAAA